MTESTASPMGRARSLVAGRDPLPTVVALVSLAVYLAHGWLGALLRDLSIYVYAGQQVLHGHAPYVGILNRAGPLAHLVPALGIALGRVFGLSDVVGARLFFMVVSIACVVSVYFWGRLVLGTRLAGLAGAAAMLCFHGFVEYATNGPREKSVMVLLFVWVLIDLHKRNWLRAGVWLALSTLTLQIIFPPGAAAALVALVAAGAGARLRGLLRFAAGGIAATAVVALYFLVVGALDDAVQGFLVINARYTTPDPFFDAAQANWNHLVDGYGASLAVLILGAVALLVAGVVAALTWRRPAEDPLATRARAVAPAAAAVVLAVIWSMRDFDNWPDAFPLLPLAAFGVALVAAVLVSSVTIRVGVAIVAIWAVVATTDAVVYATSTRTDVLAGQNALAEAIVRPLPAGSTFFTVEAPQVVALTRHTLISRYVMYSAGLSKYMQDTYPGGLAGLSRWIEKSDPTVITVISRRPVPLWLQPVLDRDYVQITAPQWRVYLARSAGADVRAKVVRGVRRAVAAHPDLR